MNILLTFNSNHIGAQEQEGQYYLHYYVSGAVAHYAPLPITTPLMKASHLLQY